MLSLLLELFVSVVLCGALVFFAFLNAPVEAGTGSDDEGTASAVDGAYELALLPPQDLPLFTVLSRYVALGEDTVCGTAYRWLLMSALHYAAREVYSDEHLREWGGSGDGVGETEVERGASSEEKSNSGSGSTVEVAAQQRRSRRRHRRGGPPTSTAAPMPLRYESAHWVNVLLRWAAFLSLGGGTVTPDVWTDHLLFYTERGLAAVNDGYAKKMRVRAAQTRVVASQLADAQQQQRESSPLAFHAPQQRLPSSSANAAAASPFTASKSVVRVELLELGAGLLGGPAREVRRPQLSTGDGLFHGVGRGPSGGPDASGQPGSFSPSLSASPTATGGGVGAGPSAAAVNANNHANVCATGSTNSNSPPLSSTHSTPTPNAQPPPLHTSAGVLLSSSMAGISSALADVVSSATTGNAGSTNRSSGVGGGEGGVGGSGGDYATACGSGTGLTMAGAGAQLGVVLPRVEGDVISVEQPYTSEATATFSSAAAAGAESSSTNVKANASSNSSHRSLPPPPLTPLRCFAVPLLYEDQRFHLRLGCCLPLGALLPVSLCVPPDVLTLDCAVAVRRVIFNGHLYAALHGPRVELSFPVAPQFTAVVEVMPDYAGGLREAHIGNSSGGSYSGLRSGGGGGMPPLSSVVGAARTLGHTFTAVNTTRNETTAMREGGGGGLRRKEPSPPARPPLPPFTLYPTGCHLNSGGCGLHATTTTTAPTTGTSSINERNENVQEVVLLAVRRLIQSLTYPNVLAGELVCAPGGYGNDDNGGGDGSPAGSALSMRWKRTSASLPLRM
ncbi:hypothetical protein ABB37_06891 [Leptomonas pyrrhocoris]|uniref:Uncharacterized protein n=1 Tax=Leptomonas pyrrhocoris TaxID=157538 RepID=A0A0M9FWH8_LEPPY|nr:hypothetical protein ABB37_06891 [Leptomonas pyrrhocoris]XP_015655945.1 hypothetical protein ABB37_06891 [Leptomonas pyrrhocoris]KPA77505.1 hypothetical protein ABB37_06891 [Leptomonas pyrrhocoris]KPA77506.1 hypothetical protein ABB37_06891 [Leptomonas pyrrhocoris]|eukprot:XP_015655944.1 hypothetical protein ABB37_06891 [Leptomonas pyrrhocoris]